MPLTVLRTVRCRDHRLARFFDTTPDFSMSLQSLYDLTVAEKQAGNDIAATKPARAA